MNTHGVKIIKSFPDPFSCRLDEEEWYELYEENFVIVNCTATDIYYPVHWTPLSLKAVISGKEYYDLGAVTFGVTNENLLILNNGSTYSSYINDRFPTESFTINFSRTVCQKLLDSVSRDINDMLSNPFQERNESLVFYERLHPNEGRLSRLIVQLHRIVQEEICREDAMKDLLFEIFCEMILLQRESLSQVGQIRAVKSSTKIELFKRLNTAKDYIDSCYYRDISLDELSSICLLNPFYLIREFKKNYSTTPYQYLITRRLIEAKKLLTNDHLSVNEISSQVGFDSVSTFCSLFKKRFNTTPTIYRIGSDDRKGLIP